MARLSISPINDDDQSRVILLKLANEHGAKQCDASGRLLLIDRVFCACRISVSLRDLLGVGAELGGVPTWLLTLLILIAVGLVCVISVIVCMRQQLFCFNGKRAKRRKTSSEAKKTIDGNL